MQLSFTEKKNIRKSFGKLKESLSIPNLIEVQKNSYKELTEFKEDVEQHFADTSTLCLFKRAFRSLPLWTLMPNGLALIGDRVIYECLKTMPLKLHRHGIRTLVYESRWANHYQLAGKSPQGALHEPNWEQLRVELPMLLDQFQKMTGLQLSAEP